jgi:hypothetical protein
MKKKGTKIPTKNDWIDYKGRVFIIESSNDGTFGKYQYNGVMCNQGSVNGLVIASFKSTYKWFSSDWWYKKTSWSADKFKVYFSVKNNNKSNRIMTTGEFRDTAIDPLYEKYCAGKYKMIPDNKWAQFSKEVSEHKNAVPSDKILKFIFERIKKETGMILSPSFKDLTYGVSWFEAAIGAVDKETGKKYLITWENCD